MKKVNALAVRKSLGAVLAEMKRTGRPVLVTRDRKTVAALVPIEVFKRRFVDFFTEDAVAAMLEELRALQSPSRGRDSLDELRALREA